MDDEDSSDTPDLIPDVSVEYNGSADSIIIAPKTLKVLTENIEGAQKKGSITVKYPEIKQIVSEKFSNEYDEDEQLYAAIMEKSLNDKFTGLDIPIYEYLNYLIVTIPHISNSVALNVLGDQISSKLSIKNWIVLSPSQLNNNETLNKITKGKVNELVEQIPQMKPPHFITGISASVISSLVPKDVSLIGLILNAEGQSGFEKLDNESLIDASYVISHLLRLDSKYLKSVSLSVRKFNGYSNSGMYI